MSPTRIVLTGATGFVGSHVLRGLAAAHETDPGITVRALARTAPESRPAPGVTWTPADLTDPASLRGVMSGADVLVHLASRISGDEAQCAAVNVEGTTALVDEAVRCGVGRVVHLSTTAVYGAGPHRGIAVNEITPAPVSAASRTRLLGETPALAAGGIVLRPGLVLGAGDRWVVPALAELLDRVPARWDGGRGLLSLVDVNDLARLITTLATTPHAPASGIYHASHPEPVNNGELMAQLAALDVLPPTEDDWPWEKCLHHLHRTPGTISERQFSLLAQDHWYDANTIWHTLPCPEGPGPVSRLTEAAPWYRTFLRESRRRHDGRPVRA
ncbi:NAD-dependent epimerase/dehydratase family protein [Streptomyces sp. NPDC093600]|uniref:NAD-dependent epimerase/dehydratase family protein n=1 Tax=Streptomyces sp. NPDC093600 TaxID=3366047 RepID=UPI0037F9609A